MSPQGASSSSAAATARSIAARVSIRDPARHESSVRRFAARCSSRRSALAEARVIGAEVRADRLARRQGGRDELLGDEEQVLVLVLGLGARACGRCARQAAMTDAACARPAAVAHQPGVLPHQFLQRRARERSGRRRSRALPPSRGHSSAGSRQPGTRTRERRGGPEPDAASDSDRVAGTRAEHGALQQRVRGQPVRAVHAGAGDLADRVETGQAWCARRDR